MGKIIAKIFKGKKKARKFAPLATLIILVILMVGIWAASQLAGSGTRFLPMAGPTSPSCDNTGLITPTPCPHATYNCVYRTCSCKAFRGDCDGIWDNGCEKDLTNDKENCGSCGRQCSDNQECHLRQCRPLPPPTATPTPPFSCQHDDNCGGHGDCDSNNKCACENGYANCNGDWNDGCEINLTNDNNNCGECSHGCMSGRECIQGSCQSSAGTPTPTSGWVPTPTPTTASNSCSSDRQCGANAYCPYSQYPSYRVCRCRYNYANCDRSWINGCEVDVMNDKNNCRQCGRKCSSGQRCVSGFCQRS